MRTVTCFILLSLALASCAGSESAQYSANKPASSVAVAPAAEERNKMAAANSNGGGGPQGLLPESSPQSNPVPTERKIIRNAELGLESGNPEETQNKIASIAESKGGFVVETQQSMSDRRSSTRDTVTMTVRVPAAKFSEAIEEIRKTAGRVTNETVKGEDVTEEFIDIEARLRTQKALEAQFLEIMKQARTVEDALNVQSRIAQVRGEIERIEGRKKFLENQAAFSTIKIRIQTPAAFSGSSPGFFYRLTESVSNGIDAALSFILGFVSFVIAILPFLLLVVLPLVVGIRYFWRRRAKPRTTKEIVEEEIKD